jgi:hypothetical protein
MPILAPFILTRVLDETSAARALKRNLILAQDCTACYWGTKLVALWVAVARVNFYIFSDEVKYPKGLDTVAYYIAKESELFLEVGQPVKGFEKATPNFHIGLHIPEQIYLCISLTMLLVLTQIARLLFSRRLYTRWCTGSDLTVT